ncbi:hypothetical protein BDU57DRAFT_525732 [Ampelomyces quisqualis]|uniref:Uncharacterized protein n=1 Tax=Ampelomyces quisqualis TaxID=50730 RepID=A0A6A5R1Q7_AMPQU|nr:hypothetical protein BDU57DRAFT_525732 [Ampelomyces quisqualis]
MYEQTIVELHCRRHCFAIFSLPFTTFLLYRITSHALCSDRQKIVFNNPQVTEELPAVNIMGDMSADVGPCSKPSTIAAIDQVGSNVKTLLTKIGGMDGETPEAYLLSYMWTFVMLIARFRQIAVGVRPDSEMPHVLNYRKNIAEFFNKYERTDFAQQMMKQDVLYTNLVMNELATFKADMGRFDRLDTQVAVYASNTSVGKRRFKVKLDEEAGVDQSTLRVNSKRRVTHWWTVVEPKGPQIYKRTQGDSYHQLSSNYTASSFDIGISLGDEDTDEEDYNAEYGTDSDDSFIVDDDEACENQDADYDYTTPADERANESDGDGDADPERHAMHIYGEPKSLYERESESEFESDSQLASRAKQASNRRLERGPRMRPMTESRMRMLVRCGRFDSEVLDMSD